jgi:hypothetical protein
MWLSSFARRLLDLLVGQVGDCAVDQVRTVAGGDDLHAGLAASTLTAWPARTWAAWTGLHRGALAMARDRASARIGRATLGPRSVSGYLASSNR